MVAGRQDEGLVVIGAGLMRTGTNSLQLALQRLLHGRCYHMYTVVDNLSHTEFWNAAFSKDPSDAEWRAFFAEYKAAVDLPAALYYRQLMAAFPEAKVVLTVRDPDRWHRSVAATVAPVTESLRRFPINILNRLSGMQRLADMLHNLYATWLGPDFNFNDKERMVAVYNRHVDEVRRVVPPDRLLVFDAKEGWEPLCRFLGVDVPYEPFPHVNTTSETKARISKVRKVQWCICLGVLLAAGGVAYLTWRRANLSLASLFSLQAKGEL